MRKILTLVLFFSIISMVFAIDYGVWLHDIKIEVDSEGEALISEKFHLFFPNEDEKIAFREKSLELGSNLNKWAEFDKKFTSKIGFNNITKGTITYSEGEDNYLELKYSLADEIMAKGKETTLVEEFNVKANYFNELYQSGLWIIPDNTRVTIVLPPGAEIRDSFSPEGIIGNEGTKKTITWNGYKSANELKIKYVIWKKINPIVDLNQVTNFLFRTTEGLVVITVILIIVGVVVWKRSFLASKIEKFSENNTQFEED
jgi:hypothetical protein